MKKFKNGVFAAETLVKRDVLLFFRDKALLFFSMLSPLIMLILYVLFLRDVQISSISSVVGSFPGGKDATAQKDIAAFADSWLIAGILCVATTTVALNAMLIMVSDKEKNVYRDFRAAPASPAVLTFGYGVGAYAVDVLICILTFFVGIIYLAVSGTLILTAANFFKTVGILLLACLNATAFMLFFMGFFKSNSAASAFSGIFSAFFPMIMGAYMPASTFPEALQTVVALIPGSSAGGLLRGTLMEGALGRLSADAPPEMVSAFRQTWAFDLRFGGEYLGGTYMYLMLASSFAVMAVLCVIAEKFRKDGNFPRKLNNKLNNKKPPENV